MRSRQQSGSKIVVVETEKTNSKYILKVELRVLEEEGTMTEKLRMIPRFLMLENGRIVVPFTEMSKTGCGI